jgi:16S rRNA (cytidine1402-2'-O)-methyltransferase
VLPDDCADYTSMTESSGVLYIVATPLGNLGDISQRALDILKHVDLIAAEDTRHSGRLLQHFGIGAKMFSLHEHNEQKQSERLLHLLEEGNSLALISDAGTPLISDPGYRLVQRAREAGYRVVPIPGPSALIAALSVAGLPTDRFVFEGFLPAKQKARRQQLEGLADEPRTLVFYESCHRIQASLSDMLEIFGADRQAVIARELTKAYEQIQGGRLGFLLEWLDSDPHHLKGEFVVLVHGAVQEEGVAEGLDEEALQTLKVLMEELPLKQAAKLTARRHKLPNRLVYQTGLALRAAKD